MQISLIRAMILLFLLQFTDIFILAQEHMLFVPGAGVWNHELKDMPAMRSMHSSCVIAHKIYVMGGMTWDDDIGVLADNMFIYDTRMDTWEIREIPNAFKRIEPSLISIDDKIFVLGGRSYELLREGYHQYFSVDVYDPDTNTWQSRANSPCKSVVSACYLGGKIYVAGGDSFYGDMDAMDQVVGVLSDKAFCYDPQTDQWSGIASLDSARSLHALLSQNGKLYAIGGLTSDLQYGQYASNNVEVYDPEKNEWSSGPSLDLGRCSMKGPRESSIAFFTGGVRKRGLSFPLTSMYYLDSELNEWIYFGNLPQGLMSHSVEYVDNTIYVIGGSDNMYPTNKIWAYSLPQDKEKKVNKKLYDIYPNPIHDRLVISLNGRNVTAVDIIRLDGFKIFHEDNPGNRLEIDMSDCHSGIYFVTVKTEYSLHTERIILL